MGDVGFIVMSVGPLYYDRVVGDDNETPVETVSEWEKIGLLSFARFYDLTMDETIVMINNPNETLHGMMEEMKQSMMRYEEFMVKVRRADEEQIVWTRSDILDFG